MSALRQCDSCLGLDDTHAPNPVKLYDVIGFAHLKVGTNHTVGFNLSLSGLTAGMQDLCARCLRELIRRAAKDLLDRYPQLPE